MFDRATDRWFFALTLTALLLGLGAWGQLPPGAQVPIHFNLHGVPDGWGSPAVAFLIMPGVAAAVWGLRRLLDASGPTASAADRERVARALDQIFLATAGLMTTAQLIIAAVAISDWRPAAAHLLLPLALVLFVAGRASFRLADPRDSQGASSSGALSTLRWATTAFSVLVFAFVAYQALGVGPLPPNLLLVGVGMLLVVTGNVMGKLRPHSLEGIRTRWTLAHDRVWDHTQRFGGKAQVAAGLVLIGLAWAPLPPAWHGPAVLAVVLASSGAAAVKSYWAWRKLPPESPEPGCRVPRDE